MKFTTLLAGCALMLGAAFGASVAVAQANQAGAAFGRESSGLEIKPATPAQGSPDRAVTVQLNYSGMPSSGAVVKYRTEGALILASAASNRLSPDSRGTAQDSVTVNAASAGVYFLNVFAKAKGVTTVVSIPVTIGQAELKPVAASSVATPGGERVIEMPAQQTVR